MLQSLRDKAQGWIAWIIIGMIAITFILFGTENFFRNSGAKNTVADVQGTQITAQELDMAYKRYLNQSGNETVAQLEPNFVKKELLQSMIDETIMMTDAAKMGLTISPQRIGLMLNSIPFFIKDGQFSPEAYTRFLMNTGYTDQGFQNYLKTALIKQQLEQGLMQTAFSLTPDLDTLVKFILQKRDFRYITVERSPLEKDVKISDENIKAYYDQHVGEFKTNEQVALEYVILSLADILKEYQPTADEIKAFYAENAAMFTDPEKVHVEHILIVLPKDADEKTLEAAKAKITEVQDKLKKGESFETLAKTYSDDKASRENGGQLEWITKGEMIPEFEQAAFALEKKDDVSGPVRTDFGFHLIKLLDKQPAKERPFESVKDEIVSKMQHEKAQEKFVRVADQMNDLAFDHPDSLQPIADKLGLKIEKTDFFSKDTPLKETLLQSPTVVAAAFNPTVKDDKNNSDLLKLDEDTYMVLRVANIIPSKQKTLDEVKPEIVKALLYKDSANLAKEQATKIYAQITKEKLALDKIQSEFPWKDATDISRQATTVNAEIIEASFSMPNPSPKGTFKMVELEDGNYGIVWLTKVTDGDITKLSAQEKESFQEQLSKHFGELEFALYATELIKEAKVEKYLDRI